MNKWGLILIIIFILFVFFPTVSHWIKDGLSMEEWSSILKNHAEYCYKNRRDMARSIGYFQVPVSKALGKSRDSRANNIIKGIANNKRL